MNRSQRRTSAGWRIAQTPNRTYASRTRKTPHGSQDCGAGFAVLVHVHWHKKKKNLLSRIFHWYAILIF